MDNFSEKTKSLLVDIKEEQIQEQQEVLSDDNGKEIEEEVEKPAVKQTSEHEQIFSDKKPKKTKTKNKVKFEVVENEIIKEQGQPDKNEEQGQLPMTYRQRKKLEKEAKKAEQKRLKEIEKAKKREETAERNRQKSRERYWREKEKKEKEQQEIQNEIPQKIVSETKSKLNNFQKQEVKQKLNNNMDFYQFASYMSQYENLKSQYQKEKELKQQQLKQQQEQKQKQEALQRKQERERVIPFAHQFRRNNGMPNMFI